MQRRTACAGLAAACVWPARAAQFEPGGKGMVARPEQDFVPPAAGSYALPPIQDAADGWVLEGNWVPRRLSRYTHGALTLLSFVYTYCTDPIGCPLAYETFVDVRRRVLADPELAARVRFVSLSFDPRNDTPEAMRTYGGDFARATQPRWHFLTTHSLNRLAPILEGFGQDTETEQDDAGRATRVITHMLKVFLIDERAKVREIYSAAFLQPEVIVNDLRTLALASKARAATAG
jgi:protein SCO1